MHLSSTDNAATDVATALSPATRARRRQRVMLDAAAGALAGAVSRVIVGPLDVIKIRFQVQLEPIGNSGSIRGPAGQQRSHYTGLLNAFRTVIAEEGVRGLWTGTVPGLLLTVPYTAVQFVALQQCKEAAARLGWEGRSSTAVAFTSGALAGAAATVASYPFDLLRTTLAAQGQPKVYKGMTDAAVAICRDQGLRGLYRGLGVTLVEIMPYAALQFGLYDTFHKAWTAGADAAAARRRRAAAQQQRQAAANTPWLQQAGNGELAGEGFSIWDNRRLQAFTCGLAAGLLAKLGSHPLDVAKKRYQVAGLPRSLRYGQRVDSGLALRPLLTCLSDIHAREGISGLWKGSVPSIIKAAPAAAITFTVYEALVGLLVAWSNSSSTHGIEDVRAKK